MTGSSTETKVIPPVRAITGSSTETKVIPPVRATTGSLVEIWGIGATSSLLISIAL